MPRGQTGRSYLWFGMLVAAALIVWLLLSRAGRPPSAPAPAAGRAPAGAAGPQAARAPQAPAPPGAPATRAGTAEEAGSTPAPETPPALSPGAAGADERQLVKIARGLTLGPDGTLRVSAAPPGSVVGQLHLQPGDVIVTVNGRAVSTPEDFARLYHEQGPPTELTLLRDGQEIHRH